MKIKYLGCDGVTEGEEDIISAEFYEYEHPVTREITQGIECTRPEGDIFVVDCIDVYNVKA